MAGGDGDYAPFILGVAPGEKGDIIFDFFTDEDNSKQILSNAKFEFFEANGNLYLRNINSNDKGKESLEENNRKHTEKDAFK